jgi:hypothetical protein
VKKWYSTLVLKECFDDDEGTTRRSILFLSLKDHDEKGQYLLVPLQTIGY